MTEPTLDEMLERAFEQSRDLEAPLADRLQAFADAVREANHEFAEAVDCLVHRLKKNGSGTTAPAIGEPMPPFMLPDQHGRLVSLESLLEKGPVAISFQRGHWCPYCRITTNALAQARDELSALGAQIVAITPDLQRYALALQADAHVKPFPILTDIDNGYALSLDLAIFVGLEMRAYMTEAGWDIAPYQGNDAWVLPIPATFAVGSDGVIRARFVDPDYRKRMAIEDIIDALRAAATT